MCTVFLKQKQETMSEQRKYTLVCFLNELCGGQKSIDLVPSKWIHDNKDEKCRSLCAFPDKFTDFDKLVKSRKPASKSWTLYPVIIKGHAGKVVKHKPSCCFSLGIVKPQLLCWNEQNKIII